MASILMVLMTSIKHLTACAEASTVAAVRIIQGRGLGQVQVRTRGIGIRSRAVEEECWQEQGVDRCKGRCQPVIFWGLDVVKPTKNA